MAELPKDERTRDEGTPLWKIVLGGVLVYVAGSVVVDSLREWRQRRRLELDAGALD